MATGGEQGQLSESTCSVCFEHYRLPKVLPCSHLFCHLCLRSMATATDSGFSCPICRQEVNITAQGVDSLQTFLCLGGCTAVAASQTDYVMIKKNQQFPIEIGITAVNTFCNSNAASGLNRKPLTENYGTIAFSRNPETVLRCVHLTAENKLWVKYKPPCNVADFLSIYDSEGNFHGRFIEESVKGDSLTCLGDVLLSPLTWRWIDPDGRSGNLDLSPNNWALCSKSLPPYILLLSSDSKNVPPKKAAFTVYCLGQTSTDPLTVTMTPVVQQLIMDRKPYYFDVFCDRLWLAFSYYDLIEIYYLDCNTPKLFSRRNTLSVTVRDIAFTTLCRQPVLAVASDSCVSVYDFQDGFVTLKTLSLNNYTRNSIFLAADNNGKLWCESQKGHITVTALSNI